MNEDPGPEKQLGKPQETEWTHETWQNCVWGDAGHVISADDQLV